MFSPFECMVAGRYLRARKAEGFVSAIAAFSFLGIMLGVATLIIVMAVMNGFRQELIGRIVGLNGHVNVYAVSGPLFDYDFIAQNVAQIPNVRGVYPSIEGQALVSVNGAASGVMVRGLRAEDFAQKPILSGSVIMGDLDGFVDDGIAIGNEMARRYHLTLGDRITLVSPKGKSSPFGTMPRSRSYQVGMIFDVGMYEYNSSFIYMPLDAARAFFQLPPDAVSSLEVVVPNPVHSQPVRNVIETALKGRASVSDWREMNATFFSTLQVERNVMFVILTMIILVAAFNIISSMIMLVKDKGRDIAIMRTMGAKRSSMMKIFVLTGASIGFLGTFFGAVLGIAFALNIETIRRFLEKLTNTDLFNSEIYFLSQLPAEIDWKEVAVVIAMAFTLSILATLYPAWRAARLDPVEALRYE